MWVLAVALVLALIIKPAPELVSVEDIQEISKFPVTVDLNNDGREDIVAPNRTETELYVFWNLGNGNYQKQLITELEMVTKKARLEMRKGEEPLVGLEFICPLGPVETGVRIEDKDEDGWLDIWVGDLKRSRWYMNEKYMNDYRIFRARYWKYLSKITLSFKAKY